MIQGTFSVNEHENNQSITKHFNVRIDKITFLDIILKPAKVRKENKPKDKEEIRQIVDDLFKEHEEAKKK